VTQLRKMMLEELQRRKYSQTTVKSYIRSVKAFAEYFHQPPDQLGPEHIRTWQVHLLQEKNIGVRTVRNETAARRFFFVKTLKRPYPLEEIAYPKPPHNLPTILSQEEAVRLPRRPARSSSPDLNFTAPSNQTHSKPVSRKSRAASF
jgi:integrase/recombinase XerD